MRDTMFRLVSIAYKTLFKNFPIIITFALPLLILSALNIYFRTSLEVSNATIYFVYLSLIFIPLINAATDISIYRKLFQFNIINPLSSLQAYIRYLIGQIGIGLIGTAPIFLINYIFIKLGLHPLAALCLAIVANLFIGFVFMARFYVVLPLIIQNKTPSLKEFLLYTKHPYLQWVCVATLIYLPYVAIHYFTLDCPYINMILTTIATYIFICFNVTYVNNNRLSRITYKPAIVTPVNKPVITPTLEKKTENKIKKSPKKATKSSPKKTSSKKETSSKVAGKKTTKKPAPKLKPALA